MSHVLLKYIVHIQMVGTYLKKRKEKKEKDCLLLCSSRLSSLLLLFSEIVIPMGKRKKRF